MGTLVFQANLGGSVNLIGPNTASTVNFTLPSADGTNGQALVTNGSGTLSFSSFVSSAAGSNTQVQFNSGGAFAGSANLTFNGTTLTAAGLAGPFNGTVGATTPSTGAFTTLSASSDLTLSGGTANGVLYLNGSKVATSGSALTFDGFSLGLKARTSALFYNENSDNYARIQGATGSGNELIFSLNSEAMRLTSTGLGIGTSSPLGKLDARSSNGVIGTMNTSTAAVNNTAQITLAPASAFTGAWATGPAVKGLLENTSSFATAITINPYSGSVGQFEAARFDSSGNLGLGVTPSAWSGFKAMQISYMGIAASGAGSGDASISWNAYNNGTNWVYGYTGGKAARYKLDEGTHSWFVTNTNGTAGNAITFTQAATLTASGQFLVGTTSYTTSAPEDKGVVGGNFRSIFNTATIPALSTATILTLSSTAVGVYIVNANFGGQGNNIYGGMLIVVANAGSFRIITNGSGASCALTLSGANVQITNGLGVPLDATGNAILIGNGN